MMIVSANLTVPGLTSPAGQSQRGATLIIALIMLLLISVLAIGGMQSSLMQERMAGNAQDQAISFQAAEAALRQGENNLINNLGVQQAAQQIGPLPSPAAAWDGNNPAASGTGDGGDRVNADPVFHQAMLNDFVSFSIDPSNGQSFEMFAVTSRAEGGSSQAITVLQTTVLMPLEN